MVRQYAIVDIETTGGMLRRDKIIEIAIAVHDGTEIIDRFESLVNPGRSVPEHITMLTGITTEMVQDAPRFFEIARQVVEMTEGCIFVAHNVRFDYSFIKKAFERLGYTYTRKLLCTARLSRMVYPEHRRHGLGSLIARFDIIVERRHRAMDDVLATCEVFEHLVETQKGPEAVNQIINYGIKASRLPAAISLEQLHDLPETCGVYYFHNGAGDVIYVGKSIHIKKRVMQHFAKHTPKAHRLQQRVHDITYTETGSELVALLLEEQEIKRLQPDVNRALRKKRFAYALYECRDRHGYINIRAERLKKKAPDGYTLIKEYPKLAYARGHIQGLVEEFELCTHKCGEHAGEGSCFNARIGQCKGACHGAEDVGSYNERAREAIHYLQRIIKDSFFILDKGRESNEKSVVMVEEGEMRGFGYISEDFSYGHVNELCDVIKPMPGSYDARRIIHWYVKEGKMEKVLPFSRD